MKKTILLFTNISIGMLYSQVGINTPNPQGILNVDGAKDNAPYRGSYCGTAGQ